MRVVAPAVAVTSWPWTLRYAVTRPYSKRGAKDISNGTLPDKPSTIRSSTAGESRPMSCPREPDSNASASVTATVPCPVVKTVRSTNVSSR